MSYTNQKTRQNPGTIAAVVAIHAVIGYGLVTGLAGGVFEEIAKKTMTTYDVNNVPPPPPPEPMPEPRSDPAPSAAPPTYVPPVPSPLPPRNAPIIDSTDVLPTPGPIIRVPTPGPVLTPSPTPRPEPKPAFSPQAAAPSNNPGAWVTTNDYKSAWIRREMVGTARFRLDIAANGRVDNCTITSSTGHATLDAATCELVTKRARFDAAKGTDGKATAGSYSSAVRWELPR
ncbi:energy transducer TonB [Qipengyuania atrilutea]|uniref:TonB family protein n=1 Tax=Qipengyuania atrilutea TaxID=2744473 RepID=A0A850H5C2_9SPHN|nr:TonB family protein [Actirhodobacter atriluteus]NVD45697.1 TonB family protein [Actirhodobacter atriluteus]